MTPSPKVLALVSALAMTPAYGSVSTASTAQDSTAYAAPEADATMSSVAEYDAGLRLGKPKRPRDPYIDKVSAHLYRGSAPTHAEIDELAKNGFGIVVNLRHDNSGDVDANRDEAALVEQDGMQAVHIQVHDQRAPSFDQVIQFLNLVTSSDKPTYVHCNMGEGRTGTFVAAYRIAVDGWSAGRAIDEAKQYFLDSRDQIDFINGFPDQLKQAQEGGGVPDYRSGNH